MSEGFAFVLSRQSSVLSRQSSVFSRELGTTVQQTQNNKQQSTINELMSKGFAFVLSRQSLVGSWVLLYNKHKTNNKQQSTNNKNPYFFKRDLISLSFNRASTGVRVSISIASISSLICCSSGSSS